MRLQDLNPKAKAYAKAILANRAATAKPLPTLKEVMQHGPDSEGTQRQSGANVAERGAHSPTTRQPKGQDFETRKFLAWCQANDIPQPLGGSLGEHQFHPERKWRFDWTWVPQKFAIEVDGSIWTQGRHTRGSGWLKDAEKLNEAALANWCVVHCTPQQLYSEATLDLIQRGLSRS